MPLAKLIKKKRLIAVGLNSGTSADGLDLAAITVDFAPKQKNVKFLFGMTIVYPADISRYIQAAISNRISSIDDLLILDRRIGIFFGQETSRFCRNLRRRKFSPDIIASHGQTIRHLPGKLNHAGKKQSATLQLGHPESIAYITGLTTVADFRQADIGAGGEGAPITVYPMYLLFSHKKENRLLVNIGGIANYFFFPAGRSADNSVARDCGPGNSLLDLAAARFFGKKFDRDGRLAARGKISMRLLTLMLADSYLKGKYGNSTGRERFGEKFLEKTISFAEPMGLRKYDIMATLVELTAYVIARAVREHIEKHKIKNIYLFGGGLKNRFLVKRLKSNLFMTKVVSVHQLGYNPDFLEAVCYALMGVLAIKGLRVGLPHITGAGRKTVAGRVILT